jgi:phage shock protein PspC (stress-responsive transcriptional regulator)
MNRLYRSDAEKMLGGVCGGLGEYFRLDPLLVRIAFVALAMLDGIGITLYILLWLFLPAAHKVYSDQNDMVRRNVDEMRQRAGSLGHQAHHTMSGAADATAQGNRWLVAGAAMVGIGMLLLLSNLGLLWWFSLGRLWPLLLIALGTMMVMNHLKDA